MAERRAKYAALGAVLLTVLGVMPATAAHASDQPDSAAQQLAERHVPVVMLRAQAHDCDEDGEPFSPMNVDLVLDNQQIALRQVGNGDPTVMRGPGAPDLANLGEGFYLDFPGDSLRPGCLYEQDNNRFNEQQPSVVYAHIVQQADHPDQLALQYWLFWYYNDWNNKHEGDWEFIQLLFNASTAEEALATEPVSVGYAQHEGGERAGWNSSKLERDGERPVVYTSQRSHASYYSPALYLGRSGAEGFGCDNTRAPSTRVDPRVVVLHEVTDSNDPLAWINFEGRWGERHSGPNNGPTGPNTKPQWTAPVTWSEGLRDSSFVVPSGDTRGTNLLDTFCGVVEWGSGVYIRFVASPGLVVLAIAAVVALIGFVVRRTSWDIVEPMPLVRRRRLGEIIRVSVRQVRANRATFAATVLLALPVAGIAMLLAVVARRLPFLRGFVEVSDSDGTDGRWLVATMIATGLAILAFVLISAGVAWIVGNGADVRASARDAARAVWVKVVGLVVAVVLATVALGVLSILVVGIPIAVWLFVRWQFTAQVVMLKGLGGRQALARSASLVKKRWFHTALVTVLALGAVGVVGMIVGLVLLILFTGLPLWVLSAVIALVDVLVMPYAALVLTYLYGDAVASHRTADVTEDVGDVVATP